MKSFDLLGFVAHLATLERGLDITTREIVAAGCEAIATEAKSVIGTYDATPTWPQLAESTQRDRERKGYAPNEPLLRTGELRDSITWTIVSDHEGAVGSDLDVAVFQELGTSKIPPRSFPRSSALAVAPDIADLAGAVTAGALGGQGLHELGELLHGFKHIAHAVERDFGHFVEDDDDQKGGRQ
jgi:hypothetical protein